MVRKCLAQGARNVIRCSGGGGSMVMQCVARMRVGHDGVDGIMSSKQDLHNERAVDLFMSSFPTLRCNGASKYMSRYSSASSSEAASHGRKTPLFGGRTENFLATPVVGIPRVWCCINVAREAVMGARQRHAEEAADACAVLCVDGRRASKRRAEGGRGRKEAIVRLKFATRVLRVEPREEGALCSPSLFRPWACAPRWDWASRSRRALSQVRDPSPVSGY